MEILWTVSVMYINYWSESEVDGFTTFAIHDSLGFTRWLWWFNSTRFIFSGCSKETRFPIPNYISIEVNDSTHDSFRAMANWSRFNSIQIHSWASMQNVANTPFCTFASTPTHLNLANQLQRSQLFDVAGTSEICIYFQWDKYKSIFFLCHCLPFTIGETISIDLFNK